MTKYHIDDEPTLEQIRALPRKILLEYLRRSNDLVADEINNFKFRKEQVELLRKIISEHENK